MRHMFASTAKNLFVQVGLFQCILGNLDIKAPCYSCCSKRVALTTPPQSAGAKVLNGPGYHFAAIPLSLKSESFVVHDAAIIRVHVLIDSLV